MKILILAYDFPPLSSVGSFRPYSWYKHFQQADIYSIVITRNWEQNVINIEDKFKSSNSKIRIEKTDNNLLIKLPHKNSIKENLILKYGLNKKIFFRKVITLLEELLKYQTAYFDDKHYIYKYADKFLLENKVDCILATGEPFILFKYAHNLAKKYNIPWFADYRDEWTDNHSRKKGVLPDLLNFYKKKYEKTYTSNSIGFSSVSLQLVANIEKKTLKNGALIQNGVDLDLVNSIPSNNQEDGFVIIYTGIIYKDQNIKDFLTAYENFLRKGQRENVIVKFIGIDLNPNENVSKIIDFSKRFPENLIVIPRLSQRECIIEQKRASILLNFILGSQSEGIIGAKTYEYLAIKKPILVVSTKYEDKPPLFPERSIQYFAYTDSDILTLLEKFYSQYKKEQPLVTDITDEELYEISRKKQALILADYIKKNITIYRNTDLEKI